MKINPLFVLLFVGMSVCAGDPSEKSVESQNLRKRKTTNKKVLLNKQSMFRPAIVFSEAELVDLKERQKERAEGRREGFCLGCCGGVMGTLLSICCLRLLNLYQRD